MPEHRVAVHQLTGRPPVIQKTEHRIATGSYGIGDGTAMAAGSQDQTGVHRTCGAGDWEAELEATAKGMATR